MAETDRPDRGTDEPSSDPEKQPGTTLDSEAVEALAAIVESSDDAIYSKDSKAIITSWNAAAHRLYGYPPEEAIGRPIAMLIPPDKSGEEIDILNQILQGQRVDHYETRRLCKDGSLVDVSVSVSPVRNGQGEIVQAAVIARDLTEHRRLEKAVADTRESEAEARRRRALELHDEVVQSLTVAKMALETGQIDRVPTIVESTLERAKKIVSALLDEHQEGEEVKPGDLVRERPPEV